MNSKRSSMQSGDGTRIKELRVHHLLCIPLFVGEGYSDAFSRNMTAIIRSLKEHSAEPLRAVCRADMICKGCPNLQADGTCANSERPCGVDEKDRALAGAIDIAPEEVYSFGELMEIAGERLTEEIFDGSCANCQWYRQGLCSYEKWKIGSGC